jgi:hypothetical protein
MIARFLVVVSLALVLAGCNNDGLSPVSQASPQKLAQIKTIAIITAFDNRIETKYSGEMSTSSWTRKYPVEWPIDDYVKNAAANLLRERYTIKDIPYSPAAVYQEATLGDRLLGGSPQVGPRAQKVVPAGAVDLIVFIAPGARETGSGVLLNQPLEGVGYYSKNNLFYGLIQWVYIAYQVTLIDGRTFQAIDYATGGSPGENLFKMTAMPHRDVKGWPAANVGYNGLSKEQREEFKRLTYDMFDNTLPDTFRRLGLRP